ncbi:hypothetical protein MTZ49_03210 [Entomomonas sp. E2T0]|uniref:hypothetical protein n=1 Tax=Entomomonas sp. E2T0 TaxID=2930213 RepID=UPI0022285063|nr:hypothetical protein [Entomomonas sp. E2T0]UYZ84586.1 hypothetical protein MTZ49_03210 [Entomomonas sp. E2T0]
MNKGLNKSKLKKDYSVASIFFAVIFVGLGLLQQGLLIQVIMLFFLVPCFLLFVAISLFRRQWNVLFTKFALWLVAITLGLLGQYYLYYVWKQEASQVIIFLDHYKQEKNQYPETVIFNKLLSSKLNGKYRFFYNCNEKTNFYPMLLSPSPNMPFDTYNYDFKDKKWHYRAD